MNGEVSEVSFSATEQQDVLTAIYHLPIPTDEDVLFKVFKTVFEDGELRLREYFAKTTQRIPSNFERKWVETRLTPYEESDFNAYLTKFVYSEARKNGWESSQMRQQKGSKAMKPPSVRLLKQAENRLQEGVKLDQALRKQKERALPESQKSFIEAQIINKFGGCYYHPYMKKSEIPEDEEDYKGKLTMIVDCEVIVVEATEYVIKTPGKREDDKEVRYLLQLYKNEQKRVTSEVNHEQLTTKAKFDTFLVSKGFVKFMGDNSMFNKFHEFLINGQQYPTVRKETSWGEFEPGKFLFKNGMYDTAEQQFYPADAQDRIAVNHQVIVCPTGNELVQPPILSLPDNAEDSREFLTRIFTVWEKLNGRVNVRCTVAYALACLFNRHILEDIGGFPILFNYGSNGTGKSTSLDWLMALFGHRTGNRQQLTKQNTIKGLTRNMTYPRGFPFYLDDYRNHETNSGAPDMTSPMLNWYHQTGSSRAKTSNDNQTIETRMRAAVVMTGNDKPTDHAVLSRLIILTFHKPAKRAEQELIPQISNQLHRFSEFTALALFSYPMLLVEFDRFREENRRYLAEQSFDGRAVNNWSVILGGIQSIPVLLPGLTHWQEDFEGLRNEICRSIKKEAELQKQSNPLYDFFDALEYGATQRKERGEWINKDMKAIDHRHFRCKVGRVQMANGELYEDYILYLNLHGIWKALESVSDAITRTTSLKLIESKLQNSSFYLEHGIQVPLTKELGSNKESNRRCYALDVRQLKAHQKLEELLEKAQEYERNRPLRFV